VTPRSQNSPLVYAAPAVTWVYAARAVSLPALYTEPTAAQILPNFLFRAGARTPGRLLDGDALGQDQCQVDVQDPPRTADDPS
jgi:hypothetical protein